jgi:predicted ATPase
LKKNVMLKSLQIENFKAFGARAIVPLAPITLIYGENSAGKSSILHSLQLLCQTLASRQKESALVPRSQNGDQDFGSFKNMVFDHNTNLAISFRIETEKRTKHIDPFSNETTIHTQQSKMEFSFARKTSENEISLDEISIFDTNCDEPLASFSRDPTKVATFERYFFDPEPQIRYCHKAPFPLRLSYADMNSPFWERQYPIFLKFQKAFQKSIDDVSDEIEEASIHYNQLGTRYDDGWDDPEDLEKEIQWLNDLFSQEMSPEFFRNFVLDYNSHYYLSLFSFLPEQYNLFCNRDIVQYTIDKAINSLPYPNFPDLCREAVESGLQIAKHLLNIFTLGPFRNPPSRWYAFSGTNPVDVGANGQSLPDLLFRNDKVRLAANKWLGRLDMGYEIKIRRLGGRDSDLYELKLRDTRRRKSVEVGMADVGFGVSQVLPLIAQSVAGTGKTITVEQPEVHIHPRLQADLADLLIETSLPPRDNQFLIETHSEHLALRLLRRVREKAIPPDHISILYVSRGPTGSKVHRLRIDEEGRFLDDFPGGFFPERLRELG